MTGTISQIQVLYNPEEDRILLRINSAEKQEFRFWLTRRFSILMLQVLFKHAESDPDISLQKDPLAKRTIQQFKREQAISSAELEKPFRNDSEQFPLGERAQLAFRLTHNRIGENLRLGVHPKAGEGINMVINRNINANLTQLLLKAIQQAQWNLTVVRSDPSPPGNGKPVIN